MPTGNGHQTQQGHAPVQREQIHENAYRCQQIGGHLRQEMGQCRLHTLHLIYHDLFEPSAGGVQNVPKGKRGIWPEPSSGCPSGCKGGLVGGKEPDCKAGFWPDSPQGPPCTTEDRSSSPAARSVGYQGYAPAEITADPAGHPPPRRRWRQSGRRDVLLPSRHRRSRGLYVFCINKPPFS